MRECDITSAGGGEIIRKSAEITNQLRDIGHIIKVKMTRSQKSFHSQKGGLEGIHNSRPMFSVFQLFFIAFCICILYLRQPIYIARQADLVRPRGQVAHALAQTHPPDQML